MNPVALLQDLVAISSVSSESNVPIIRYAQEILGRIGWAWGDYGYTDDDGVPKMNLVGWPESHPPQEGRCELSLVCHTDTVPYDWPEATKPSIRDGSILGRGACDVKGFLACALAAIEEVHGPVSLILTADEEIGCVGARRLAELQAIRPRYAIIGEPTSLQPIRAGKGYCLAELLVPGREAHSAFPELGESAIYRAAEVIDQVRQLERELRSVRDEQFDPPYTTLNLGVIRGGRAKNVVPGECTMLLEWRPIPGEPPDRVVGFIKNCEVRILRLQPGFASSSNSPVLSRLCELTGLPSGTVSFGTEAPWLAQLGALAIVFGPGDMRVAHSRYEHVPIDQLSVCKTLLIQTILSL